MFLEFYQLREQPFGVTPNPRFLLMTESHREALASLMYGVQEGRGFVSLIAPPGTGKTTLLFQFMESLRGSANSVFLFQTQCNSHELLHYILSDLGIDSRGDDLVQMHEKLNRELLRMKQSGTKFVLIIDEAQDLDDSVLETVRLLSDFETHSSKLIQIVLSGQPALAAKLETPQLLQLRQRITICAQLRPLSDDEVNQYIDNRLALAGYQGPSLFTSEARAFIAARSEGIPRNINSLCFNALSLGYALGQKRIDKEILKEVAADLEMHSPTRVAADSQMHSPTQAAVDLEMRSPTRNEKTPAVPASQGDDETAILNALRAGMKTTPTGSRTRIVALVLGVILAAILSLTLFNYSNGFPSWLSHAFDQGSTSKVETAAISNASQQNDEAQPVPRSSKRAGASAGRPKNRIANSKDSKSNGPDFPTSSPTAPSHSNPSTEGEAAPFSPLPKGTSPLPASLRNGPDPNAVGITKPNPNRRQVAVATDSHQLNDRRAATRQAQQSAGLIEFVTVPAGLEVSVDGSLLGPSPAQAYLEPGWHEFRIMPPSDGPPASGLFEMKPSTFLRKTIKWDSRNDSPEGSPASDQPKTTERSTPKNSTPPDHNLESKPVLRMQILDGGGSVQRNRT